MKTFTPTPEACQLLLEGTLALSEIEGHGIRIDRDYLEKALTDTAEQIKSLEQKMRQDDDYRLWSRQFGDRTNLASAEQLATIVFTEKGFKSKVKTKSGKRASASEKALEGINLPIVKMYLEMQHLRKGRDAFLAGIHREMVQHEDGDHYIHTNFNLNIAITFRSSSDSPNLHNMPTRSPMMADMVRRCMVPRRGHQFVEMDFGQIEVRIPTAYSYDPNLMGYCCDPTKDMHREVACQLFMLEPGQVSKGSRHLAKNQCVFPFFYGSYYLQIAKNVWEFLDIYQYKIEGTDKTIKEHLAEHGITELGECDSTKSPVKGTYEYHVKEIEDDFWNVRFPVHAQWKKDWIAAYYENGGYQFKSGFITVGPHKRNEITSYCIQGDAAMCKLWSLVQVNKKLKRYKMRSRCINEIHDAFLFDADPKERDDLIDIAVQVMTQDIKKWAMWLPVPLTAEPEACPIDKSWYDKVSLKEEKGTWVPVKMKDWEKSYGPWGDQCL